MSLHLGLRFHPVRCVWCCPVAMYRNLKEPFIMKMSDSLASLNPISVASVMNPSLWVEKTKALDKDSEADERKTTKEEERRRKIGLANKGKVPWNKGRKHTDDTRRRIKQRTIEALRNPKVRKKMTEHQQPHSDETKEKIRASVKKVWEERSRSKRLMEKFMSLWSENIAEAARKGGSGEQELDWDSYESAMQEILSEQQLELAEEKARMKKENKKRAEEAALARTDKMRRAAERKKEREERDRRRERKIRKPKQNNENATVASCSKLKKRLTKIHKKKTRRGKIAIGKDRVVSVAAKLEKLDLELIRKERTRGDISLADQIQAAKNLRGSRFDLFAMSSMDFD